MSKPRFKVGDLAYWSTCTGSHADVGLVTKIHYEEAEYYPILQILWLASGDGIGHYEASEVYTQQQWEAR